MNTKVRLIQKRRHFTEDFKRQVVKEFESGKFSVLQLGKLYKIERAVLYRWIYKFSNFNEKGYRIVEKSKSSSDKLKDYQKRIAELERALGSKQIQIDYLETMIDVAKDELGIDIKKNSNTPQLGGSKKKKSK